MSFVHIGLCTGSSSLFLVVIITLKKLASCIAILFFCGALSSCSLLWNPFWGGGGDDDDRTIEPTLKFSLAIGGVAPGRDELVIYDESGQVMDLSSRQLNCLTDKNILHFEPRPDNDTYAEGSGMLIVPTEAGVATLTCLIDGVPLSDTYEVTISPQNLIQILLAEAGTQLKEEATVDDKVVQLESVSPTGNAIASVIRNRINLIEANGQPSLFSVDESAFDSNPDVSYYDAVISAPGQFSPTDPTDPGYQIFTDSADRNFLEKDWRTTYDQAVLTAAGVYNDDTNDPAGGAFAFLSPTLEQWLVISEALASGTLDMPEASGVSDDNFPAFAPLQILVLNGTWTYEDGRPAFIFMRHRTADKPAVTNQL